MSCPPSLLLPAARRQAGVIGSLIKWNAGLEAPYNQKVKIFITSDALKILVRNVACDILSEQPRWSNQILGKGIEPGLERVVGIVAPYSEVASQFMMGRFVFVGLA